MKGNKASRLLGHKRLQPPLNSIYFQPLPLWFKCERTIVGWHWYVCVRVCLWSVVWFSAPTFTRTSLLSDQSCKLRPMKENVCVCVCVCVSVSVRVCCGGQRCRWGGGVFIAFNPGQWDCRGESERVLFELMKRKPFTLLHKDAQLCLCYGLPFSLKVEWNGMEQNISFALCSLFRFNPQKSTKSHANRKQDLRNGWGSLEM